MAVQRQRRGLPILHRPGGDAADWLTMILDHEDEIAISARVARRWWCPAQFAGEDIDVTNLI